ncbi:MAG: hypothetical protein K2H89_03000 [Oscillospiraceae bacterium]|nr:hypothetical protein [Oscillospiraceae bacterium]
MKTKRLHPELKFLLQNLAGDAELPPEESQASEASRQKVNQIMEKINQEQEPPVPVSKPVYNRPPRHKKILTAPVPVQHFSEEPSQNPAVRMHDRLLRDAMPKPDPERKPRKPMQNTSQKNTGTKNKTKNKKPKKQFHIEIGELPPDIPRDTSVADRIRQEQLEKTLAAVPPKTPEQIRKEQVRKRALEIRERMKQQEALAAQTPEPEEEIPTWEEQLAAFSENISENSSDQLRVFEHTETIRKPVLSDMPEIPGKLSEDTSLLEIAGKLQESIPDAGSTPPVTEIIMTPRDSSCSTETAPPDLSFQQTAVFQTVSMPKIKPRVKKKAIVTRRIKKTANMSKQGVVV